MEYTFIIDLQNQLHQTNIFKFTFVGFQAMAMLFILLNLVDKFIKNAGSEDVRVLEIPNLISMVIFVSVSGFIPDMIDNIFNSLQNAMLGSLTETNSSLDEILQNMWENQFGNVSGFWDFMSMLLGQIPFLIGYIILSFISFFTAIANIALSVSYLVVRVFLLEFMRFIFPLVIALSTSKYYRDILAKWISKYVSLYLLGIIYIGIIGFSNILTTTIFAAMNNYFSDSSTGLIIGAAPFIATITVIVVFTTKAKLFSQATSYVANLF
jgi:hypothetical protein